MTDLRAPLAVTRHLGLLAVLAVCCTLLSGCSGGQELATVQSQLDEVQRQVLQLQKDVASKEEIASLEQAVQDQTSSQRRSEADLQVSLKNLADQIGELEAKLEDTNYRLAQLSQQIAATNQELKTARVQSGGSSDRAMSDPSGNRSALVPTDPQALYQTAYSDYLRGNYDLAILGFRQYLESFPDTELADNASYWIGESYFSQGKYDQAIREFDKILGDYPRSDKTASAILKKGYAYAELGRGTDAALQLRRVIREFPDSDEANLARQRLETLESGP